MKQIGQWIIFNLRCLKAWYINTFIEHGQKIIELKELPDLYAIRYKNNGYHYKFYTRNYDRSVGILYCYGLLVINYPPLITEDWDSFLAPGPREHHEDFRGNILNAARFVYLKLEQETLLRNKTVIEEVDYIG